MNLDEMYAELETDDEYERCWETGAYAGQYCPCCPHSGECSGCDDDD